MLRQVPRISRTRIFSFLPVRLLSFIRATFRTCSRVMSPTKSDCGTPLPFLILSSCLIRALAGGVPISISYSFVSVSMITFTGTCIPAKSAVFLLISATTWPMFTPFGPSAGPNGGAALALPPVISASTASLAIFYFTLVREFVLSIVSKFIHLLFIEDACFASDPVISILELAFLYKRF